MATQIQLKRGLSENFQSINLKAGEPAFLTDLGKLYIGDGTNKILINPINKPSGIDTTNYFTKIKVNDFGQVIEAINTTANDIPDLPYDKIIGLGNVVTLDAGTSAGNVPILDSNGKLVTSIIPSISITNTFVVSSEAEMLALNVEVGDIAVRTDLNETYILQKDSPSNIDNWVKLLTPIDTVLSVNGQVGVVNLAGKDISLNGYAKAASYTNIIATDNTSIAIGKLEKNFDNFAPLSSPTLVGAPKAPTASLGDNSQLIATTEFVQTALSSIDGGTF